MTSTRSVLLLGGALIAFAIASPSVSVARTVKGDDVPRLDLDATSSGLARDVEPPATRARWMIRPTDVGAAQAAIGAAGVELVARIARLGDLWILEAPADSSARVEQIWSALGDPIADESGAPALLETTRLIGVRDQVWETYGLRGDVGGTVAILDSGCDTAHDDLGDPDTDDEDSPPFAGDDRDWADAANGLTGDPQIRVVGWHDVTDDLPLALGPWDYHYHGTALAGTAFGGGEVLASSQGVAPAGRFVVVKTWNFEERWERWASDFLLGVEWVLDHASTYGIHAVLVATVWSRDLELDASVQALIDAGIAVIAAVGNEREDAGYPARLEGVLGVGATDDLGRVTAYSAPAPADGPAGVLDVVAPGGSLLTPNGAVMVTDNDPDDGYHARVGTSLAAAHVAGAVSLISQAMLETGRPWRNDRAQVEWFTDVLRATATEVALTEPGALAPARLDRGGPDRAEGWGLLQLPAAIDAVRRVLWPGDDATFTLDAPQLGAASWAARLILAGGHPLELELVVPAGADFDLHLYEEREGRLVQVGRSVTARTGGTESLRLEVPRADFGLVVVRRVSGTGVAQLRTRREVAGRMQWPASVRSIQRSAPVPVDLDGDGDLEVVVVNNADNDATVHNFHAWHADGTSFGSFPLTVFSSGRPGELTTPAVGELDGEIAIVAGSAFGEVYAVRPTSELRWARTVGTGPTSSPTIVSSAAGTNVVIGTPTGVALLDAQGSIERTIPVAGGVSEPLAVGDLDGDTIDDLVFADAAGRVHATSLEGVALTGWPVTIGGTVLAPVLRGDGDGMGVREIVVIARDASAVLRAHRLAPDGTAQPGSPAVLPGGGDAILSSSRPVIAPLVRGERPSIVVTGLTGGVLSPLRAWAWAIDADGVVTARERLLAEITTTTTFLQSGSILVGEPRIVDVLGGGGREILAPLRVTWSMFRGVEVVRSGGYAGTVVWSAGAEPVDVVVTGDRDRTSTSGLVSPTLADLDGDLRPDWIVGRDREIHVIGSRVPEELADTWILDRASIDRRACVGCEARTVVDAPGPPPAFAVRAVPNPFNPRTELRVAVPGAGDVRFEVYDARGRRVRAWSRTAIGAGELASTFDGLDEEGRRLASGVYLATVRWNEERKVRRLVLVR